MRDVIANIHDFQDRELSLGMYLVRHSAGLNGIAIGGCRYLEYATKDEALEDAKRLARNMTLKYRVAGLDFGGLKAVIYALDETRRPESFERIGEWLESMQGTCYLATDMGTTLDDMSNMARTSKYVLELPGTLQDGTFSDLVSAGVLSSLEATIGSPWQSAKLKGQKAFVLGLGASGYRVARDLLSRDCEVTGFDSNPRKNDAAAAIGVQVKAQPAESYDLFVPCAGSDILSHSDSQLLKASVVGGSANNPVGLSQEQILYNRGIIVVPDFIISAGAILVDDVIIAGHTPKFALGLARTERIYDATVESLRLSRAKGITPRDAAYRIFGGQ